MVQTIWIILTIICKFIYFIVGPKFIIFLIFHCPLIFYIDLQLSPLFLLPKRILLLFLLFFYFCCRLSFRWPYAFTVVFPGSRVAKTPSYLTLPHVYLFFPLNFCPSNSFSNFPPKNAVVPVIFPNYTVSLLFLFWISLQSSNTLSSLSL